MIKAIGSERTSKVLPADEMTTERQSLHDT